MAASGFTYLILTDVIGGTVRLTTESPIGHFGMPVLRVESEELSGDFAPADMLVDPEGGAAGAETAAEIVHAWASELGRTDEEIEAAQRFLVQWPYGPQLEG
jgi:hypothetical protein